MSRLRTATVLACGLLLLAGAMRAWPGQVDDAYISLVFSHELVEHGRLSWSDGRVVEGFSNPLWVLIGALFAATPWDPSWLLQALSLLLGIAVVVRLAPPPAALREAPVLALVPVLVAASDAMGWWSGNAMETMLYSGLLVLGWTGVASGATTTRGLMLLLLAALTRTEGHLQLAAGGLVVLVRDRRLLVLAPAVLGLLAWHTLRVAWFGELLPLPTLVKGLDGAGLGPGLRQLATDLLPWTGVLLFAGMHARRHRGLALLPVAIQAVVLVKAGGDWMGHGRLLLPGVLATLALWRDAAGARPARGATRAGLVLACAGPLTLSPTGNPTALQLRNPVAALAHLPTSRVDLDTTLQSDLQFVVPRVPAGAIIYSSDIGMLGHVEDLVVRDMIGLTDADVARSRAFGDEEALARTLARMDGGPDSALCLRMVAWGGEEAPPLPAAQDAAYPHTYEFRDPWAATAWHCRAELQLDPVLAERRWARLAARFPAHGWLRWMHAVSLSELGQQAAATAALEPLQSPARWSPWDDSPTRALHFVRSSGPIRLASGGWAELRAGQFLVTRELTSEEWATLALETEGTGTVRLSREGLGCTSVTIDTTDGPLPLARVPTCGLPEPARRLRVEAGQLSSDGVARVRL